MECVDAGGLVSNGILDIHKAALRMFPVLGNFTLTTRSAAPPGRCRNVGRTRCGVVACLAQARGRGDGRAGGSEPRLAPRDPVEAGGCPAAGRISAPRPSEAFIDFRSAIRTWVWNRSRSTRFFRKPLPAGTILWPTGRSRVSGEMIARVMDAYEQGNPAVTGALRALKELAERMVEALRAGDLARVGALLGEHWIRQQELDAGMCTEEMTRLERALRGVGALGGKAAGAGAGGAMFFVVGSRMRDAVEAARSAGATVLPVTWAAEGARAC